jgi:hypothetical protein
MQVLRAENAFAARAHAAADEIKASLADIALRAHFRARKDAKQTH